jgi:hypothetical protein
MSENEPPETSISLYPLSSNATCGEGVIGSAERGGSGWNCTDQNFQQR